MKNKIIIALLLIACASCTSKAKLTDDPSQVIVTSYTSSIGEAGVSIYLPEGYTASKQDYPVLYLLHGSGDDETGWLTKGRAKTILDSLITNELCPPMIVVMPNGYLEQTGHIYPKESRLWMESTFEENFSRLMTWTENNFRTINDKQHRAIAGLSMGGFHTMHTAALRLCGYILGAIRTLYESTSCRTHFGYQRLGAFRQTSLQPNRGIASTAVCQPSSTLLDSLRCG